MISSGSAAFGGSGVGASELRGRVRLVGIEEAGIGKGWLERDGDAE